MQVRSTGPHIVSHDTSSSFLSSLDHFFGIFPAIVSSYILLSFLLTLLVSLPLSPFLTRAIGASRFGNLFAGNTLGFEKKINMVFGNAVHETLTFLTVEPESNESVVLHFATTNVTPDENAEQKMFLMVNSERTSRGLPVLLFSDNLQSVARAHAADMFAKGYFSHYTPNGLSPFDRMSIAGISYAAAGENLALAPNTDLAMNGLMQSPGHKANILSVDFGKIGVGVIDGGIYGEMFAQEFTN